MEKISGASAATAVRCILAVLKIIFLFRDSRRGISIAVGAGLAFKMKHKKNVSVAFFGDGASEEGVLHESLNFASLKKLPVIFFCENNFYAVQSSQYNTHANPKIYEQAISYGMPGIRIDGNNILEVYKATGEAIANARKGKGPFLIEAITYRWREHVGPNLDLTWVSGQRRTGKMDEKMPG